MEQKNNKNSIITKILLIIIIGCFATAGYLLFNYFNNINTQFKNSEVALVEANKAIKNETDFRKKQPQVGKVIGKIRIEGLTQDMPIIEGDDLDLSMNHGVGHIQQTPLPGTNTGQPVFSAHRETFFKPLQNAKDGDIVVVSMPYGTFRYKITHHIITGTSSEDARKIYSTDGIKTERIALITCYPFEAWTNPEKRITFYADLIE